jgi:hypothetical protein
MGYSTDCIKILNDWIVEIKRQYYTKNNSEESESLKSYTTGLEQLESNLQRAIIREDSAILERHDWPPQLMECIKDMNIRSQILDCINQAFVIHPFNRSPKHQGELKKESEGLE